MIRAGEDSGRTLSQRNIVHELAMFGNWTGGAASYPLPAAGEARLMAAILVQRGTGGPITSATRV